jgi:hypothetical protein
MNRSLISWYDQSQDNVDTYRLNVGLRNDDPYGEQDTIHSRRLIGKLSVRLKT